MKTFKNTALLIKKKRLEAGISQATLAIKLGFKNGQFISNCERARCQIPTKKLRLARKILKITIPEMLGAYLKDEEEYLRGMV